MSEPYKYINHMVFNVRDLDAAVTFYRDVVGMNVTMSFPDRRIAFLSFGKNFADIRLFEMGDQYEADRHWHGFNHVAFLPDGDVEVLDRLHQRLEANNAKIEGWESYAEGRHKSLYFYDPDGNRLEFYWENQSWVAETRGKVAKAFGEADAAAPRDAALDLYAAGTANNVKVAILLNLLDVPYTIKPVSLKPSDPKPEGFERASETGKVPAIIDHATGVAMCESGAIMMYLAEKTESELLPKTGKARAEALQWLFAASSTFTPPLTEARFYLLMNAGKAPLAEERVRGQVERVYSIAEKALARSAYLAGDQMTLGDIAFWPYCARFDWQGVDLKDYPAVREWFNRLGERGEFQKGFDLLGEGKTVPRA